MSLAEALREALRRNPRSPALRRGAETLDRAALAARIEARAEELARRPRRRAGVARRGGPDRTGRRASSRRAASARPRSFMPTASRRRCARNGRSGCGRCSIPVFVRNGLLLLRQRLARQGGPALGGPAPLLGARLPGAHGHRGLGLRRGRRARRPDLRLPARDRELAPGRRGGALLRAPARSAGRGGGSRRVVRAPLSGAGAALGARPAARWRCAGALTAGGPMAEMAAARLEADRAVPIRFGYGLTETAALGTRQHFDRPRRPGSSGLPAPGMTIAVVVEDGADVATGETGEIRIAGSSVFRGYADPAERLSLRRAGPFPNRRPRLPGRGGRAARPRARGGEHLGARPRAVRGGARRCGARKGRRLRSGGRCRWATRSACCW